MNSSSRSKSPAGCARGNAQHPNDRAPGCSHRALTSKVRPIQAVMVEILGTKTMTVSEMFDALTARGWEPNSNAPVVYVSYLFQSFKELFERVNGGGRRYRVRASNRPADANMGNGRSAGAAGQHSKAAGRSSQGNGRRA